MHYKFATADFTFPLLEHDQVIQLIALLGFEGVDIGLFEERSHLWPSREFANLTASARQLKQKLTDQGLQAADIFLQTAEDFTPYAINHPQAARREHARELFRQTLDYAAEIGCKHVTALPGVHFEEIEDYETSFGRSIDELAWRVEQANKHSIIFGTEAHVGSIVPEPVAAERLVQAVPGLNPNSRLHPLHPHWDCPTRRWSLY